MSTRRLTFDGRSERNQLMIILRRLAFEGAIEGNQSMIADMTAAEKAYRDHATKH